MSARSLITASYAIEQSILTGETVTCSGTVDNFISLRKLCDNHGFSENFPFFNGHNFAGVAWSVEWDVLIEATMRKKHRAEIIAELREVLSDLEELGPM